MFLPKKGFIGKIASYLNCHTVEGSPGLIGLLSSGRVENQQYFKVVVSISTTDFELYRSCSGFLKFLSVKSCDNSHHLA